MSTIAALATPPGRGGIGIIRISGPKALEISMRLGRQQAVWQPRHACHCSWHDSKDRIIDSGLVLFFPAPNSFTGEDIVELQAHGSPVLLRSLLDSVFTLGARAAKPGEFTRRAVENGKMDLSQAEAVASCIDAATTRASRQAQRHLQGEFGAMIDSLMHELTGLLAHVEACLDFPDEDVPPLLYETLEQQAKLNLLVPIDGLLQRASFGERLFEGARVAIIGAPNVGKSSLLNRLAGRDRAIVSNLAGTTRDVIEVDFEVHGIPVRLIDTAGLRDVSQDFVEHEGVRRAKQAAAVADVVIIMADATRPETWQSEHKADIRLMNKIDKSDANQAPDGFMGISALTGEGLDVFKTRLALLLGDVPGSEEGLLVCRERHRQALSQAKESILNGLGMLGEEDKLELVALEWRQAWATMAEIPGLGDVEQILDRVFEDFCIGK